MMDEAKVNVLVFRGGVSQPPKMLAALTYSDKTWSWIGR